MVVKGKFSEFNKLMDSVIKKEPKIRLIVNMFKKRFSSIDFKANFPEIFTEGIEKVKKLPDGSPSIFVFDSDKEILAFAFSVITRDYITKNKSKFLIHSQVRTFYMEEHQITNDFGKQAELGLIYNDEVKSPKAKFLTSKAISSILRISKFDNKRKLEDFVDSLTKKH